MKKILLTFSLLFICAISIVAQENYTFRVLATKGSNQLKSETATNKLFTGGKIYKNDKIIIGENSYVGLSHISGKTLELKKSGTYDVATISKELTAQNSTTSKKYSDYITKELTKSGGDGDMSHSRYKYMKVVGSVERGTEQIKVFAPSKSEILENSFIARWEPVDGTSVYVVEVSNMFGDIISSVETNKTQIEIKIDDKNGGRSYIWTVRAGGNNAVKSDARNISFVNKEKFDFITKNANDIKVNSGDGALGQIMLALFYEENNLQMDAMSSYEKALKLESDVDDFKIAYGQFLERVGIAEVK